MTRVSNILLLINFSDIRMGIKQLHCYVMMNVSTSFQDIIALIATPTHMVSMFLIHIAHFEDIEKFINHYETHALN